MGAGVNMPADPFGDDERVLSSDDACTLLGMSVLDLLTNPDCPGVVVRRRENDLGWECIGVDPGGLDNFVVDGEDE